MRSKHLFAGAVACGTVLRIAEVSDLGALDRAAWGSLVASAPDGTVFQSFDWLASWWDAFGGRRRALVLTAHRDTELVGAAPLLVDDAPRRRSIRFIGEDHADYLIFLARDGDPEVVEHMLDHLERRYGARYDLCFVDVPDTSVLGSLLQRRERSTPLRLLRTGVTPCPRLKIRGNEQRVAEVLRKKSLRRHAAKLAAQGAVEVRHLSDAQEILVQLEHLFEQHRRRWAVTPFPSLFEAEAVRRFYRNLVRSRLGDGSLLFTTLRVGGRLVACHFGLMSPADFLWYKPSFDVRLSRLSPGEVLLRELLLLARERGVEYFDFTRGDEAFKSRFASEIRYNGSYLIYSSRVAALTARFRAFTNGVLQRNLSESSSTGRLLRQLKQTFATARRSGAGFPKAVLASVLLAGNVWGRWLVSRRTVHLFSAQGSPPLHSEPGGGVLEASLEYLLDGSNRLAELLASNKQFLADAHKRLAQGERCFVIEEQERVAAVGWVSPRSPHPLTEVEAALRFTGQIVVLYDFQIAPNGRGRELCLKLLAGIRSALGAVTALVYTESSNAGSLEGIRRAGFTHEAAIENRILLGQRRLTTRLIRPHAIAWEVQPSSARVKETRIE